MSDLAPRKTLLGDCVFLIQIGTAVVIGITQFLRLLETTEGQLLSRFFVVEVFFILHLLLALAAHRAQPSRVTIQTIWTYVAWLGTFGLSALGIFLSAGGYMWSLRDTVTVLIAIVGACVVFLGMRVWKIPLSDPMPKGVLAIFYKILPQFVLAFEIMLNGAAGIPGATIVAGNVSPVVRVVQVWFSVRESGWSERNRRWLFVSEVLATIGWATVSIAWAFWFFGR